ncbi:Uncharacterised protein [Raoultella terrigena]|uniref:DUF72 domain-containing protein n=1 Tax=Raoultella terrigena TaxID=577 RepID=A0A3P8KVZ6_RAOTE|nr:Uncharacterised protein [Raoultella terrigena]
MVTAHHPLVRFIGSDDMAQNHELFRIWLQTLPKWSQSTTPYLFLHTPDIAHAPALVDTLWGRFTRGAARRRPGTVNSSADLSFLISCYDSRSHLTQ